jgi:hypothetical protein
MTQKRKLTHSPTLADHLGLRQHFTMHSPLPIEHCADELRDIANPVKGLGLFQYNSQYVHLTPIDTNTLHIHIVHNMRGRGMDYTTAQADFELRDNGAGDTELYGKAWMSYWLVGYTVAIPAVILVVAVIGFIIAFSEIGFFPPLFIFPLFASAICGFYIWRSHRDRTIVLEQIAQAVKADDIHIESHNG